MRMIIKTQLAVAGLVGLFYMQSAFLEMLAFVYGALLGIATTCLIKHGAHQTLQVAVEKASQGMVVMYGHFLIRYLVVVLGLFAGVKWLSLMGAPMVVGFIVMMLVQVGVVFYLGCFSRGEEAGYGR